MAYSKNRHRFSMSFDSDTFELLKQYCGNGEESAQSIAKFVESCVYKELHSNENYSRAELVQNIKELRNCLINMFNIIKKSKSI